MPDTALKEPAVEANANVDPKESMVDSETAERVAITVDASDAIEPELVSKETADALALHEKITAGISEVKKLALRNLELAQHLVEMQEKKGYLALAMKTWEEYLASLDLGRTHLSFLLKLGKAGDLTQFVERGMDASHIVEYAKHVGIPEKIPAAIAATFDDVAKLPVRQAGKSIAAFVDEHPEYRKPRALKPAAPMPEQTSSGSVTTTEDAASHAPEPAESSPTRSPAPAKEAKPAKTLGVPKPAPAPVKAAAIKAKLIAEYMAMTSPERREFFAGLKDALAEMEYNN